MISFVCCRDNDSYWPNGDIEYRLQSSVDGFAVDASSGKSIVTFFVVIHICVLKEHKALDSCCGLSQILQMGRVLSKHLKKLKVYIALRGKLISELRDVTCHM